MAPFTLDVMEKARGQESRYNINGAFREMKEAEQQLKAILQTAYGARTIDSRAIVSYLELLYPEHALGFDIIPDWLQIMRDTEMAEKEDGWEEVGGTPYSFHIYDYWLRGQDLRYLAPLSAAFPPTKSHRNRSGKGVSQNRFDELRVGESHGPSPINPQPNVPSDLLRRTLLENGIANIPTMPQGSRALDALLQDQDIWSMSIGERSILARDWEIGAREHTREDHTASFESLKKVAESYKRCAFSSPTWSHSDGKCGTSLIKK